jgi:hypothetical protein
MENLSFEKRSTPILTAKKWLPNTEVVGEFKGTRERQVLDRQTGEVKIVTDYLLIDLKTSQVTALAGNAGLKSAFLDARVNTGEIVKIMKLDKTDIGNGRTVNNYDIMVAKKH